MSELKLRGTGVAVVTPFRKDGSIDFQSLENLVKHLISNGVDYIVALGTTSEAPTLSKDEKFAVINFIADTVDKKVPLVVGMGGNNTQEVVNSIKENSFENIDAILSVVPYYNKPGQDGIYEHYKSVASASPVPVILYNVPGRTSCNMDAETTLKLAKDFKNIIAVKEASGDFEQIMKIVKNKPENFQVISGDDLLTLPLISIGLEGVITVIGNAFPKEMSDMVNYALEGNFEKANTIHYSLTDIISDIFVDGNPAGVKAALSVLGFTDNNLRLPLTPVNRTLYNKIEKHVKELQS